MRWWHSKERAWQKAIAKDSPTLLAQLHQQEGLSSQKAEQWLYQALCHHHWEAGVWLIESTPLNVNAKAKDGKWIEHSLLWIAAIEDAPNSLLRALIQKGACPFEQHSSHLSDAASPFAIFWSQRKTDILFHCIQSISPDQNQHAIYVSLSTLFYEMQNKEAREVVLKLLQTPFFSMNEWSLSSGPWHYFSEAIVLFANAIPASELTEIMSWLKDKGASEFYKKHHTSPLLDISRCGSIAIFEHWRDLHASEDWMALPLSELLLHALHNASSAPIEYYLAISSKIEDWVGIKEDGSPLQKAFHTRPDVYASMMNYIHVQEEKWALNQAISPSSVIVTKKRL